MEQELRVVAGRVEVRAGKRGQTLVGTGIRFNELSSDLGGFREQFAPGSVRWNDDFRVVNQHNNSQVFGRLGAGTARIVVDSIGAHFEADPPDAQWARDAMASILRKDIYQNSFKFSVNANGESWARDAQGTMVRTITDATLYEMGPQTEPAYPTTTVALRSLAEATKAGRVQASSLDDYRRRLAAMAPERDRPLTGSYAQLPVDLQRPPNTRDARVLHDWGKRRERALEEITARSRAAVRTDSEPPPRRWKPGNINADTRAIAIHEASHVVGRLRKGLQVRMAKLTTDARGNVTGGFVSYTDSRDLVASLAGPVGEALFRSGLRNATDALRYASDSDRIAIDRADGGARANGLREAEAVVRAGWLLVETIADELIAHGEVDAFVLDKITKRYDSELARGLAAQRAVARWAGDTVDA